jgi:uncharacterized protein (TIGR03545 family)
MNTTDTNSKKSKGPIRFEAIIPVMLIVAGVSIYCALFLDHHIRKALEFIGYSVVGAEVNVASVNSSFTKASIRIEGLQITNSEKPTHNSIEIQEIRFAMSWDALLRGKILIDESYIENLKIDSARKTIGKVKPPEPPSNEPSAVAKEAERLKRVALEKAKSNYSENVLGDIAAILSGTDSKEQFAKIEGTLESKAMLAKFESDLNQRKADWDQKFKTLPNNNDLDSLSNRFKAVKSKDFKSPQELQDSLKQYEQILKEADSKFKIIQSTVADLNKDAKTIEDEAKKIEQQIKVDIKELESRLRLPKIDANSIVSALFQHYAGPYIAKVNQYKAMAEKYVPPNVMKKVKGDNKEEEPEIEIQPRPRANGISYEFGRPNSYPLFWIKKAGISSKSTGSKEAGNLKGEITNISSNQILTGLPTVALLEGNFPSNEIYDFKSKLTIDNRKKDSHINFALNVGQYFINERELINNKDVKLSFEKAKATLDINLDLVSLSNLSISANNSINDLKYNISSENKTIQEVLTNVFTGIPTVTLDFTGKGILPDVPLEIKSNLGPALQSGFEKEVQNKIDEAKKKVQAYVDEQIGKERAKIEVQVAEFKKKYSDEAKKIEALAVAKQTEINTQIEKTKKDAEEQGNAAKKQAEEKAKKQLQEQVEKALGKDAKKKAEELKKKLGF